MQDMHQPKQEIGGGRHFVTGFFDSIVESLD